jgi:hypothetical protein
MQEHRHAFFEVTETVTGWRWVAVAPDRVSLLGRGEAEGRALAERLAKACIESWEAGL